MRLYDITRPVFAGMPVWPGDAPCRVGWTARISAGDGANVAELGLSAHTGTHADGPFHVREGGLRIGEAPLEAFLGQALLVDAPEGGSLDGEWARSVAGAGPERLLVRTGCWTDPLIFPETFPAPTAEAARVLLAAGLRLYGTDAPSVDPFDSAGLPAHCVLCGGGAGILENLFLDGVPEGRYELIALPLRLMEADASPVRAVLRGG